MVNKLGEVLDIEAADSYMKRPAGPMVTIEVKDIAKLAGYIRIPSMAEGAAFTDMIRQKILYSGLSNQCRKCRRFGHQARTCNTVRSSVQEGAVHRVLSATDNKHLSTRSTPTFASRVRGQDSSAVPRQDPRVLSTHQGRVESKISRSQTSTPPRTTDPPKNRPGSQSFDPEQRRTSAEARENRNAVDPTPSPIRAEEGTQVEVKKPPEEATTPRTSLFFEPTGRNYPEAQKTEACMNPFASPTNGSHGGDIRARCQEDVLEGWCFQGRKKHPPKLASPRPDARPALS